MDKKPGIKKKKRRPNIEAAKALPTIDPTKKVEKETVKRETREEKRKAKRDANKGNRRQNIVERSIWEDEIKRVPWSRPARREMSEGGGGGGGGGGSGVRRPTVKRSGDNFFGGGVKGESKMNTAQEDMEEYMELVGDDMDGFVVHRGHQDHQTVPIKLEHLAAPNQLNVSALLQHLADNDELTILQFPDRLPVSVYPPIDENSDMVDGDDEPVQGSCDNFPQGRFGAIKIYRNVRTGKVKSRFELHTSEPDQEEACQVKFNITSTHDSICAQELFTIQESKVSEVQKPEVVILGNCKTKLVCTPIIDSNQ